MPLHKRRAVFVEIDRSRSNCVLRIGRIGIITAAMKKVSLAMNLFHGLQKKLNNFGMKIAADQNLGLGANKLHIVGENNPLHVDRALRQGHPSKIRENARKSL